MQGSFSEIDKIPFISLRVVAAGGLGGVGCGGDARAVIESPEPTR